MSDTKDTSTDKHTEPSGNVPNNPGRGKYAHMGFFKRIVDDIEKQAEFYSTVFELKQMGPIHYPEKSVITGGPIADVNFSPTVENGAIFALMKYMDRPAPPPGSMIFGIMTSDIDALMKRAVASGGRVVQPIRDLRPVFEMKVSYMEDPEGHLIEVAELK